MIIQKIRNVLSTVKLPLTSYKHKLMEYSIVFAIFLLFGLFLAHKQDISMADIGRHIRNGEFVFVDPQVLVTNYFSYTEPDFPVVNHHWGAGVLFYLIWKGAGFEGLHVFCVFLYLLTFGIFFWIAKKQNGLAIAALSAIPMIPILAVRSEMRPEVFSYLIAGLFLWLLVQWREKENAFRRLLILLPVLEVFWVNLHVYFILGPAIVGVFWLDSLRTGTSREHARKLSLLLLLTFLATLLNPSGLQGALAPFTIFQNYGYSVIENKPVWYVDQFYNMLDTLYFKIGSALLTVSFIWAAFKRWREIPMPYFVFGSVFSAMAWLAIRNFALFALFAVPIMSTNITLIVNGSKDRRERRSRPMILLVLVVTIALFYSGMLNTFLRLPPEVGFGLATGNSAAADFIKRNNVQGPIFNNYEVGGYLIFYLFPEVRVFVDNRPEAYSEAFFQEAYIPMQQNEEKWREVDNFFGFKTIIVARGDMTPWMSAFLYARMNDPKWSRVFSDQFILIFTKR